MTHQNDHTTGLLSVATAGFMALEQFNRDMRARRRPPRRVRRKVSQES